MCSKFYKPIFLFIMTMLFISNWSITWASTGASTDDNCAAAKAMAADLFAIAVTEIDDSKFNKGANACYNYFELGVHAGIDLQTKDVADKLTADRKFYALEDGEVVFIGGKFGDVAIYNESKKTLVSYLHARQFSSEIKVGDSVEKGTYLGIQGNVGLGYTEATKMEHVHVEVLKLASKPTNREKTLTKTATSTSPDLVNPLEYFGYKKSCETSNSSAATVASVTATRVGDDDVHFSKDENGVFQLKSLGNNTKHQIKLVGNGFIDDGGCPANITVQWKFANGKQQSGDIKSVESNDKEITFSFNEGSGEDRLGEWEFTIKKSSTVIATVKASVMSDISITSSCFSDIDGLSDKKKKAICSLKEEGIISGYQGATVKPNNSINRAEFVKVISMAHSKAHMSDIDDCTDADNKFYDVLKDDWWCEYVKYASSKELVSGYSAANAPCKKEDDKNSNNKNYFCPGGNITYQESLKMIFKSIFSLDGGWVGDPNILSSNGAPFNSYVGCARDLKLLGEGVVFNFNGAIQRGDLFLALYNARQLIKSKENSNEKLTLKTDLACSFE